jgi:hypothetical protein
MSKLKAELKIEQDSKANEELFKCISPEFPGRCTIKNENGKSEIKISIDSESIKDAASELNSASKYLMLFDKTKKLALEKKDGA